MTELERLRDELADENCNTIVIDNAREQNRVHFRKGWEALLSHLQSQADEFDRNAAFALAPHYSASVVASGKAHLTRIEDGLQLGYIDGRETQFEQDRARIALETLKRNDAVEMASKLEARVEELATLIREKGIK